MPPVVTTKAPTKLSNELNLGPDNSLLQCSKSCTTPSLSPTSRASSRQLDARRNNHALKLQTIASKNNYYRLSFFTRTIKEWNELEPSVEEAKSSSQFKAELGRASLH
ncbi:hypothetical protein Bbelb_253370 [Branchiostoma belcheri]|nr:hypothetical protein Bbelb_253370 [Branchiostoma belcheri]